MGPNNPQRFAPQPARAAAGVLISATAVAVVVGWVLQFPLLVQIRADWSPVQPDTAIGLGLAGIGLLLAAWNRYVLTFCVGALTASLGGLILAQYVFELDIAAYLALLTGWAASDTLQPGKMAPNTALCLLLTGAALSAIRWLPLLSALFGVGACALGAGALLGYAMGLDATYEWGSLTPMAPATAAAFLLLGSTLAWQNASAALRPAWRGPILVGLGSAAMAMLFFHALVTREDAQIKASVDATTYRIRTEIRTKIEERTSALAALAREWEDKIFRWRGAWESDARLVLSRSPGMDSIEWVKRDGKIGWTYPPDADHPALALPTKTADAGPPHEWARPVKFADGTRGLRLAVALGDSDEPKGWLCGVFRSRELFEAFSTALPSGYAVRVRSGKTTIYDNRPRGAAGEWSRTLPLQKGLALSLTVQPVPGWLEQQRSVLPQVVLVAGLALSGLLVWALRAAQLSAARARSLDAEVQAHKRVEQRVRELNVDLEDRVAERTAALERTNQKLTRFASFLSHELRQPVSAQALWAELLETQYGAALDGQGREYIGEIQRSVRRMDDLITGQLALSEASSTPLASEFVDIGSLVREVTADLKAALEEAGATVRANDLPSVRGDSRQLYQLIRNLVDNSVKYRRPDVPLQLRLSSSPAGDSVEIVYEDNGQGFCPEDAERVFGIYERVGSREISGLGLGMAICRRIMERHGGTITAEGRPGEGASFRMRFPSPSEEP